MHWCFAFNDIHLSTSVPPFAVRTCLPRGCVLTPRAICAGWTPSRRCARGRAPAATPPSSRPTRRPRPRPRAQPLPPRGWESVGACSTHRSVRFAVSPSPRQPSPGLRITPVSPFPRPRVSLSHPESPSPTWGGGGRGVLDRTCTQLLGLIVLHASMQHMAVLRRLLTLLSSALLFYPELRTRLS